jgi:8-oxo-dGTP pyrophosphatase MutT (NUDIX family)
MNLSDIHPIQRGILTKLMQHATPLNYGKLLPNSMKFESDKFNYHLQFLVKERLVEKFDEGYKLTELGLKVISTFTATGEQAIKLKVSVALIVLRDNNGVREVLLQNRLRHPFYGDINSIAGKIKPGEKIIDSAKRKLLEEAGHQADFQFVGVLRKCRLNKQDEILEDTLYHYCIAENPTGEMTELNEYGENFWAPVSNALALMKDNYDEGEEDRKIFTNLMNGDLSWFYLEQTRVVEGYTKG